MSQLRYRKIPTEQGYKFSPSGATIANIKYDSDELVDLSKSYLVVNVTPVGYDQAGNEQVLPLAFSSKLGIVPFTASSLFRSVKHFSHVNSQYYEEIQDVNVLTNNLNFVCDSMQDSKRKALTGDGFTWSDDGLAVSSPFSKPQNFSDTLSTIVPADVIVPMKDLLFNTGDNQIFPAPLLGQMELELEIESRKRIVGSVGLGYTLTTRLAYGLEAGVLAADLPINTDGKIVIKSIWKDGVESPITIDTDNVNGEDDIKRMFFLYNNTRTLFTFQSGAGVYFGVEIQKLEYQETGSGTDIFNTAIPNFSVVLYFKNIVVIPAGDYTTDDLSIMQNAQVESTNFTINKIDMVLCERLVPQDEKDKILKTMQEKGMTYRTVKSESFVVPETIASFQKQLEIDPMTYNTMITCTAQEVPGISGDGEDFRGDNQLLSSNLELLGYRVQINNIDTTNRDVPLRGMDQAYQLYLHKLENGVKRLGKPMKNKEMFLDYKFNHGTLFVRPMRGSDAENYYNAIWEPVDKVDEQQTLKLQLYKGTNHGLIGTLFKFIERTMSF